MKILFIDTAHPLLLNGLQAAGFDCVEAYDWSRERVLEELPAFHGVTIRSRITVDREFIDCATSLRFIARAGAGMESIDVTYAQSKGVACISSPEGNRDAVGEHAIGMLLSLFNNLNKADREVRSGKWIREGNRGHELQGRTVGIIGYGNMGSSFAKKLSGFGCRVIAYDKYKSGFGDSYVEEVALEAIREHADVLSLHVPLTPETEYMINEEFLRSFRKNIAVINTARGKCVRTDDLAAAIRSGKVIGVCLDVVEYEETSFEKFDPACIAGPSQETWNFLCSSDKVLLSPHIAGWTFESLEKIATVLLQKITAAFKP